MDNTHEILEQARREVAARRSARHTLQSDQPWIWAFVALGLTLALGLVLLPIRGLDYRLQMVVHGVCAQAHYLNIGALRMPLCARNTGIYAGFAGALLALVALGRARAAQLPPIPITLALVLGVLAMAVDGVNSLLLDIGVPNLYAPRNELRVASGLLMGTAIAVFMLLMLNVALRRTPGADRRVVDSWIEYAALLLVDLGVYLLVFFGPPFLYYPLAILSVGGITAVLFASNMFVFAMIGGQEGRVERLAQLARPATLGLIFAGLELALLAGLRLWVERSVGMAM
jgi:uncharacterized membrane protein